jgi:hypothetical protein
MTDGTVKMKDGTTSMLKEGQYLISRQLIFLNRQLTTGGFF